MKKFFSLILVVCMVFAICSFEAAAEAECDCDPGCACRLRDLSPMEREIIFYQVAAEKGINAAYLIAAASQTTQQTATQAPPPQSTLVPLYDVGPSPVDEDFIAIEELRLVYAGDGLYRPDIKVRCLYPEGALQTYPQDLDINCNFLDANGDVIGSYTACFEHLAHGQAMWSSANGFRHMNGDDSFDPYEVSRIQFSWYKMRTISGGRAVWQQEWDLLEPVVFNVTDLQSDVPINLKAPLALVPERSLEAGYYTSFFLPGDGTVQGYGDSSDNRLDVSGWTDIVDIAASVFTFGLKSDGTPIASGDPNEIFGWHGIINTSGWRDVVDLCAGYHHLLGLRSDGTVIATGWHTDGQCDTSEWTDIVALAAGEDHSVGLKADGSVVAVGDNSEMQCKVSGWEDIVAVAACGDHTIGLKADGTVVTAGLNDYGQCDVGGWTNIVAISTCRMHTIGLKSDGTVVAAGSNYAEQCDVDNWTDIIAVKAGWAHTLGLCADGTVVATGYNNHGQCDISA